MHIDIQYKPAHAMATVRLDGGESIRAESGAMVTHTNDIAVGTDGPLSGKAGGLLANLKRTLLSGETFFTNTFTAQGLYGEVSLAPKLCGDMVVHDLEASEELFIQGSSFVAAPDTVRLDTKFQGFKGLFSGESLFFLKATGHGPVLINAFGAIEERELDGELVVDTGHLVAFTEGISYAVQTASRSWIASYFSGEGLVLRMFGRGTLYLQTRNPAEYGAGVGRRLPPRRE